MFPAAPKDTKLTENEIKLTEKSYLDPDMPIGPQNYKCSDCNKSFLQIKTLLDHQKNEHSREIEMKREQRITNISAPSRLEDQKITILENTPSKLDKSTENTNSILYKSSTEDTPSKLDTSLDSPSKHKVEVIKKLADEWDDEEEADGLGGETLSEEIPLELLKAAETNSTEHPENRNPSRTGSAKSETLEDISKEVEGIKAEMKKNAAEGDRKEAQGRRKEAEGGTEEEDEESIVADVDDILSDTDKLISSVTSALNGQPSKVTINSTSITSSGSPLISSGTSLTGSGISLSSSGTTPLKRKLEAISQSPVGPSRATVLDLNSSAKKRPSEPTVLDLNSSKTGTSEQCEECYECFEDQEMLSWHMLNDHQ